MVFLDLHAGLKAPDLLRDMCDGLISSSYRLLSYEDIDKKKAALTYRMEFV